MFEHKTSIYKLLNLARQAYQRHILIAEHLDEHFNISYDVFTPDPLLDATIDMLSNHIKDQGLLMWWLRHGEDDYFYADPNRLGGCEIYSAKGLMDYYGAAVKADNAAREMMQ